MTSTEESRGGPPSIEQFSDLEDDFVFPKGLEGQALIFFMQYLMGWSRQDKFMRLWGVFGEDFLLFLSVFQGETIKVPPVKTLQKMKSYIRIYTFLWERNFSDEGYSQCERLFGRKRYHLERIVARVEKVLSRLDSRCSVPELE